LSEKDKPLISARGLSKKYGEFMAIKDLNISVNKGEVFGLLGPNGAGKTTFILMLLGLTEPTSGSCRVFDYNPVKNPIEVKRVCGYLPERFGFYENMSAEENLRYIARLNELTGEKAASLIDEALSDVGLIKDKNQKVSKFSRGMKQRLGIANAFFKKPQLVILDEPTQGIDPLGIEEILKLFKRLNREDDTTILLSSHSMQQVQEICTGVGIISKGQLRKKGSIKVLESEGLSFTIEVEAGGLNEKIINSLKEIQGVKNVGRKGSKELVINSTADVRSIVSEKIVKNGASLTRMSLREQFLLEVYRKYSEE